MVVKTKPVKKVSVRKSKPVSKKQYAMIVTAKISYGPFKDKSLAAAAYKKVQQVPRAQVSKLAKTTRGYTFSASMLYGLKNAAQKASAVKTIKTHAPAARISFRKA